MNLFAFSGREQILARVAPITDKPDTDHRMRVAVQHARRKGPAAVEFAQQQAFDRAIAALVHDIPVSSEISEWFRNEKLIPQKKRGWRRTITNPVVLSIALALVVIAGVLVFIIMERMNEFPGSSTARKMLTVAASMRGVTLDPVEADAGALSDFFFMKYRLEHYDVPPEFADLRTSGVRVFDDDEGHRVAQISVIEKRMQFFLFPAAQNPKDAKPLEFTGWRYVENEGWVGAVQVNDGICFMAALRGQRRDLAPYLARSHPEATAQASPR